MSAKPPARQAQQRAAQERKKKQQQYLLIGGAAVAVVVILAGALLLLNPPRTATSTGSAVCSNLITVADEGREHLAPGEPTTVFKSQPPSSGKHDPNPLPAGLYGTDADVSRMVHSLEHGYIVVYYNNISQDQVNQLAAIQNSDPVKMIVAPYVNMPYKVAIVAWDRMQTCDGVNEQAIRSFTAQFRNQGPEQAP